MMSIYPHHYGLYLHFLPVRHLISCDDLISIYKREEEGRRDAGDDK